MLIEENKLLAPYTTLGIGGAARWFVETSTEEDVVEAAQWARDLALPVFVLGGGSNLLVSDKGFDGLVMRVALRGIDVDAVPETNDVIFRAGAGEDWERCVERATQADCAGIECLAGIPGTVGGTPVQNVGAYGQEVAATIHRVRAFDLLEQAFTEFSAEECQFSYRRSRFNSTDRGRYLVTRVDYRLEHHGAPTLRYADLQRAFAGDAQPSLTAVAHAVRKIRQGKGMLIVKDDPDCRSAGSFFKNPVIGEDQVRAIGAAAGQAPPRFPAGGEGEAKGLVKVPAAWLIERAGFNKGYVLGNAGLSTRHTLAIVNRGQASAADVMALAERITGAVMKQFGVALEMEPVRIGF